MMPIPIHSQKMKIWLVAPSLHGHRGIWIQHLYNQLCEMHYSVDILSLRIDSSSGDSSDKTIGPELFRRITFVDSDKELRYFCKQRFKPSLVIPIFVEVDNFLPWLTLRSINFVGIVMRPYLENSTLAGTLRWLFKLLLIYFNVYVRKNKLGLLSIPFASNSGRSLTWIKDDVTLNRVTDYITSNLSKSKKCNDYSENILVPGFLSSRKNPKFAIATFDILKMEFNSQMQLIFQGHTHELFSVNRIEDEEQQIKHIDGFLETNTFYGVIESSRVVFLPYQNRGASGLVIESLVLGVPVVIIGNKRWKHLQSLSNGMLSHSRSDPRSAARAVQGAISVERKSLHHLLKSESLDGVFNFVAKSINAIS